MTSKLTVIFYIILCLEAGIVLTLLPWVHPFGWAMGGSLFLPTIAEVGLQVCADGFFGWCAAAVTVLGVSFLMHSGDTHFRRLSCAATEGRPNKRPLDAKTPRRPRRPMPFISTRRRTSLPKARDARTLRGIEFARSSRASRGSHGGRHARSTAREKSSTAHALRTRRARCRLTRPASRNARQRPSDTPRRGSDGVHPPHRPSREWPDFRRPFSSGFDTHARGTSGSTRGCADFAVFGPIFAPRRNASTARRSESLLWPSHPRSRPFPRDCPRRHHAENVRRARAGAHGIAAIRLFHDATRSANGARD